MPDEQAMIGRPQIRKKRGGHCRYRCGCESFSTYNVSIEEGGSSFLHQSLCSSSTQGAILFITAANVLKDDAGVWICSLLRSTPLPPGQVQSYVGLVGVLQKVAFLASPIAGRTWDSDTLVGRLPRGRCGHTTRPGPSQRPGTSASLRKGPPALSWSSQFTIL